MTKNRLIPSSMPELALQEASTSWLWTVLSTQSSTNRRQDCFVQYIMTSCCVFSITYLGDIVYIIIISRPCIHIVKIIIFCTLFHYKLGHKNEEQWPGFEFKEIITILFSCHVFFTRVLGSSFCCVLSSLMPAEQGQGMTMEWCTVEDWRLCQQHKRKQKTEEGGGFISITSGMPRTFLEWHVYGTKLGKSTLIL